MKIRTHIHPVQTIVKNHVYPWDEMLIGDTFVWPDEITRETVRKLVTNASKRMKPKRFTCAHQFCIRVK